MYINMHAYSFDKICKNLNIISSLYSFNHLWHILCICISPVIILEGISLAIVLGSKEGRKLWFTLGVMFYAGILLLEP